MTQDLSYYRFKNSREPHSVIPQRKSPWGHLSGSWVEEKLGDSSPRTVSPVLPMISSPCSCHAVLGHMSDLRRFVPIVLGLFFFLSCFSESPPPVSFNYFLPLAYKEMGSIVMCSHAGPYVFLFSQLPSKAHTTYGSHLPSNNPPSCTQFHPLSSPAALTSLHPEFLPFFDLKI